MRIVLKLFVTAAAVVSLGCTSSRSVSQLTDAQRDTAHLVMQQAEQLELQRQHLVALQEERSHIHQELASLRVELEGLRQANSARAPQPAAKPAVRANGAPVAKNSPRHNLPQFDESGKVILGKEEWVWFDLLGRSVKARVDTGVKASVVYAADIQLFERNGDQWVRFGLTIGRDGELSADTPAAFEAPLLRRVKVRAANGGEAESRPVVRLKIKLGDLKEDTEFVLVRRATSGLPVVLGRSFLRDLAVVDTTRKYTQNKNTESSSL